MKPIELHHSFVKNFAKRVLRDEKLRKQYAKRLDMFIGGKRDAPIYDHPLTAGLEGRRSFSITGDIRVVYVEFEDKIIFIDIGSHNQVY